MTPRPSFDRAAHPRVLLPLALLLAAAGALSCGDAAGPEGGPVRFQVAPSFAEVAGAAVDDQPALLVDNIRLEMKSADGVVLLDTVVVWPVDQDTLRMEIVFEAPPGLQSFEYLLEARIGEVPIFAMEGVFDVAGPVLDPVLDYVGPGVNAATATIAGPASLVAGDTVRLAAVVRDADGAALDDVAVLWSALDSAAATVDPTGLITAGVRLDLPAGIIARVPFTDVADTLTLGVVPASVVASPGLDTLNALGDTAAITAAAFAVDGSPATGGTFEWAAVEDSSGNPVGGLADASARGTALIALATGVARVAVIAAGATDTAEVFIRQVPATLVLDRGDTLLAAGDSIRFTATASDSNGIAIPDAALTWFSGDSTVAVVDQAGAVVGALVGTTPVGVRFGDLADTVAVQVVPGPPATLTLAVDSLLLTALGDTVTIGASVVDGFGNAVPGTIEWSSTDPAIAVDDGGRVASVAPGAGAIIATAGEVSDTLHVLVSQVAAAVEVTAETAIATAGVSLPLVVVATDSNGFAIENPQVVWSSSDSTVAVVDGGMVTGALVGTVSLMGAMDGAADTVALEVVAGAPAQVVIDPPTLPITAIADTLPLTATVMDAFGNAASEAVTWSHSGAAIAVDATGRVAAVSSGSGTVMAMAGEASDTVEVTVVQTVDSLEISPAVATVTAGATLPLTARVLDANGFDVENAVVEWSSSNAGHASVDPAGVVLGKLTGIVLITASHGGIFASAEIGVDPGPPASVVATPGTLSFTALGETQPVSATVQDEFGNQVDIAVAWTSTDETVATVDVAGIATAIGNGTTEFVVSAADHADTVEVSVQQVVGRVEIVSETDPLLLAVGDAATLTAEAFDSRSNAMDIAGFAWGVEHPLVAELFEGNRLLAVAPGQTTVTVSADGKADALLVDVSGFLLAVSEFAGSWDGGQIVAHRGDDRPVPAIILDTTVITGAHMTHEEPAWSRDGETLAYVSQGSLFIEDVAAGGTAETLILVNDTSRIRSPAWSPSGEHIAYARAGHIHVVDVVTGETWLLTAEWEFASRIKEHPTWSADGSSIAFTLYGGDYAEIWAVDVDPGAQPLGFRAILETQTLMISAEHPAWSPVDDWIAFTGSTDDGTRAVWVLDLAGKEPIQISDPGSTFSQHQNPTWSPNGSRIAFEVCGDGCATVWVMDADGSNPHEALVGLATFAPYPAWGRPLPPVPPLQETF